MFFTLNSISVLNAAALSLFISAAVVPWVIHYDYPISTKDKENTNGQVLVGLLFAQAKGDNLAVKALNPQSINIGENIPDSWKTQQCFTETTSSFYCAPPVFPMNGWSYSTVEVSGSKVGYESPCLLSSTSSYCTSTKSISSTFPSSGSWSYQHNNPNPSLYTDKDGKIVRFSELLAAASLFIIAFVFLTWNFLVTFVGVLTAREVNLKLVFVVQLLASVLALIAMIIGGNYFQSTLAMKFNDASFTFGFGCAIVGLILTWFTLFVQYMRKFHSHMFGFWPCLTVMGDIIPGVMPKEQGGTQLYSQTTASV